MGRLNAVALVDKGDNPSATVAIHKRADVAKGPGATFAEVRGQQRVQDEVWQLSRDLVAAIQNALTDDDVEGDRGELVRQSLDQFVAAVKEALPMWLEGKAVEKGKEPKMEANEKVGLFKSLMQALGIGKDDVAKALEGDVSTETKTETKATETATAETATTAKAAAPSADSVSKADFEALQKRLEEAEKRATETTELAKRLEMEKRTAEFVQKAAALSHLPVKPDAFGVVLRKVHDGEKLSEDEEKELHRVLAAANETARVGKLFAEVGSDAGEGTAIAKAHAKADELMTADTKLTREQALARVFEADAQLMQAYEAEEQQLRAGR